MCNRLERSWSQFILWLLKNEVSSIIEGFISWRNWSLEDQFDTFETGGQRFEFREKDFFPVFCSPVIKRQEDNTPLTALFASFPLPRWTFLMSSKPIFHCFEKRIIEKNFFLLLISNLSLFHPEFHCVMRLVLCQENLFFQNSLLSWNFPDWIT